MGGIFSEFSENLDASLAAVSANMFAVLASSVTAFMILLIAITLAFYIFSMATRRVFDVIGLVYFVARSSLIFGLVTGGVIWTGYVYPFLSGFGQNVGLLIYSRFGTGKWTAADGFNVVLNDYFSDVVSTSEKLRAQIELATVVSSAEIFGVLASLITIFMTLIMVGVAFAILTIAKTFLFVFLAIAPLFLVWTYLGATKSIFEGWLQGIVRLLIVQIMVFTILGFFLATGESLLLNAGIAVDAIEGADDPDKYLLSQMWQLSFMSVMGILLLAAVPSLSTTMAGGAISVGATTASYVTGTMRTVAATAALNAGGAVSAAINNSGGAGSAVGSAGAARQAAERGEPSAKERAARIVQQVRSQSKR